MGSLVFVNYWALEFGFHILKSVALFVYDEDRHAELFHYRIPLLEKILSEQQVSNLLRSAR